MTRNSVLSRTIEYTELAKCPRLLKTLKSVKPPDLFDSIFPGNGQLGIVRSRTGKIVRGRYLHLSRYVLNSIS